MIDPKQVNPTPYLQDLVTLEKYDHEAAVSYAHQWVESTPDHPSILDRFLDLPFKDPRPARRLGSMIAALAGEPESKRHWLSRKVEQGAASKGRGVEFDPLDDLPLAPLYPSGLIRSNGDEVPWRGVTVVSGGTGLGKSKVVVRASTLAARQDNRRLVVYANAELDRPTVGLYFRQATGISPALAMDRLPNWHHVELTAGATLQPLVTYVAGRAQRHEWVERILVVVDTVNTFAEKAADPARPGAYFTVLKSIGMWAMETRRLTEGEVGFVLVSEQNKGGGVFGEKLDKWADGVLKIDPGDHPDYVHLSMPKGRYSGFSDLGVWLREHDRAAFTQPRNDDPEPDPPPGDESYAVDEFTPDLDF